MAKINLLPWRAERRKLREREFYMMLGAAAVAAVLVAGLWWYWMGARIDNQDSRSAYMKDQIHQLDGKLAEIKELEKTKSKLLARKQIIEQLQASRAQMVHLFDELVKTIPDGVRLNSLKQTADILTLEGVAQSNASVATYMRNLDNSPFLSRSDLQRTEAKGSDKRNRFEFGLTVKLRKLESDNPQDAGNDGNAAPPKAAPPAAEGTTAPPKQTPASSGGKP
jgi:type IV pilus assembly protein PilN